MSRLKRIAKSDFAVYVVVYVAVVLTLGWPWYAIWTLAYTAFTAGVVVGRRHGYEEAEKSTEKRWGLDHARVRAATAQARHEARIEETARWN